MLAGTNQVYSSFANVTAVAASSTAMTAVAASSTAKMAVYNSDTALAAIQASATALTAMRAGSGYIATSGFAATGSAANITGLNAAGSYILLGMSSSNAGGSGQSISVTTRRAGSTRTNSGFTAPSNSTVPTTVNIATPIAAPFTFTSSDAAGYTWYFGLIRCDI
jgi:hypothetical protein